MQVLAESFSAAGVPVLLSPTSRAIFPAFGAIGRSK
ncbi:hypothetical protein [Bacillus sp. STP3]